MCGITAYLGSGSAFENILSSLILLQNRGYDSAGICTIKDNKLVLHKFTSNDETALEQLKRIKSEHENNTIGIGHTRWATHGAKTSNNAHPHTDSKQMFAVVHNGIIENYLEIKNALLKEGLIFNSNTDTEVIVKLLEYHFNIEKEASFEQILAIVIKQLEGTWALVIEYVKTPNKLYLCKNGSPLVLSFTDEFAMIASEQLPLSLYFNNYYMLNDGDIVAIEKGTDGKIKLNHTYKENIITSALSITDTSCSPFPYWTIKEIVEQPQSIHRALNMGGRILNGSCVKLGGLDSQKEILLSCHNIIILGCGTSLNAGLIGAKALRDFRCFDTVATIDASEFCLEDIPNTGKTCFLLLSQSGETKDLHRCIEMLKNTDFPIVSIVNVVGSLIARESMCGIYLNAGREVGVASTKSFTSQVIVVYLLSIWFAQNKNSAYNLRVQTIQNILSISVEVEQVLTSVREQIFNLADTILDTKNIFLLGRGSLKYVADEGALKIKELCYIHAEGYAGGALKHGPFALLDKETVVILLAPKDENFSKMMNAAEEIHSRQAKLILITTPSKHTDKVMNTIFNTIITVPSNKHFQHILSIIPIQLLAYEIAIKKGLNPDFPRNLAKVVTVDG